MQVASNCESQLQHAESALAEGRFQEAYALFEAILQVDDRQSRAWHGLGVSVASLGHYQQALPALQQACHLTPDNPTIHLHLANICLALKDYLNAKKHYQLAIDLQPLNADAYNNMGNLHLKQQQYHEAKPYYQQAVHLNPAHHDAQFNLGQLLLFLGDVAAAAPHLKQAYHLRPTHLPSVYSFAVVCEETAKIDEAIKLFTEVCEHDKQHADARQHLVVCLLSQSRLSEAKPYLQDLLALCPYDANVSYNLAVIASHEHEWVQAMNYYKACLHLEPGNSSAHINIANLYLRFEDEAMAILHLENALAISPDDQATAYRLSALHAKPDFVRAPATYLQSLFDYYAPHYDLELLQELAYDVPRQISLIFNEYLTHGPYRMLDLGCGTGLCGQSAKPYAKILSGVDVSREMLAVAGAKQIYDELIEGDIHTVLEAMALTYDVVFAGDVFSYMGDLSDIFAKVRYVLQPSGWFIFTIEAASQAIEQYQLCKTSRFMHNPRYIEKTALQHQFQILEQRAITLRAQQGKPVRGMLFVGVKR